MITDLRSQTNFPDALLTESGTRITSKSKWEKQRRPELLSLFAHYMYGQMPPKPTGFKATVDATYADALGGKATLKLVTLRLGGEGAPEQHLMVVLPNKAKGRVPLFLGLNFYGNHQVLMDPRVPLPNGFVPKSTNTPANLASEKDRGAQLSMWSVEETIDQGYGFATFYNGDVEPDDRDSKAGIRAWYERKQPGKYDWGAVAAWAWGFHRAMDYLVQDPKVDAKRIAAVGHSRNGKATLLAGATDTRIAVMIPLQAGCGGTAPSRSQVGESVKRINTSFPHWFNAQFKQFNDQPEKLPFDQHCLIALCAPRPVLLPNAVEDTWANPAGQFELLKLANPVYALYGKDGLETQTMPENGVLSNGRLGYFIRPGKHSMRAEDWVVFRAYADKWLK